MAEKEVDIIKQKTDIVDFIKSYITLAPAGRNFKALCPFHQEKTPSFIVSPERQMWHCFGACSEGGDVIKFLMKYENLEFPEALKILADRAGIELKTFSPQKQKEFGILYELNEAAKKFYKKELKKQNGVLEYLKERGLKDETISDFELGFAPGGETLTLHLLNLDYDIEDIVRAGLTRKNVKGLFWDLFQKRIIFPIMNNLGKTVAFTGRILDDEKTDAPKYLNSPDSPIFNKSKILFGFHKTKNNIAKSKEVYLVEGQMDLLVTYQAGVKNAVAVSGTGLSCGHLERLRRLADTINVNFDNDEAGVRALDRALQIFGEFDFHVKAVDLGKFKDPAEAALKKPKEFLNSIKEARPAFDFLIKKVFEKLPDSDIAGRKKIIRHFLTNTKKLASAVEQGSQLKTISEITGISEISLQREMEQLEIKDKSISTELEQQCKTGEVFSSSRLVLITDRLFALAFHNQSFWEELKNLKKLIPDDYKPILDNPKSDSASLYDLGSSFIAMHSDEDSLKKEFENLINQLKIEVLEEKKKVLKNKLKQPQAKGDKKDLMKTRELFYSITKQIDELKK